MSYLFPVFSFAVFVLWLLSIVMDGPLLAAIGISDATVWFLPTHIISLFLIGIFCPAGLFNRVSPLFCLFTALFTVALPLAGVFFAPYLLVILGISGAFVAITASLSLKKSPSPIVSAVCGLVIANILAIPLMVWPNGSHWQFAMIGISLLAIPVIARRQPATVNHPEISNRWRYLPFILVFQIVSGLMYGFIMPAYQPAAYLAGAELPFYILAIPVALLLVRKNFDLTLVSGVVLGMVAFSLLQFQDMRLMINMSLFAMQAGAGFIDVALLALLLGFSNPIRAFGLGLGTVCLGILTGNIIASSFENFAEPLVLTGHVALNLSIITLYFLGRFHYSRTFSITEPTPVDSIPSGQLLQKETREDISPAMTDPALENKYMPQMPENIRLLLSDREYLVLTGTLDGKSFRKIASDLSISESSVKTYMRRIYEKMEVKGKKELFQRLSYL